MTEVPRTLEDRTLEDTQPMKLPVDMRLINIGEADGTFGEVWPENEPPSELLVAASIEDHDHSIGDRTANAWPITAQASTGRQSMLIHFHFCELVHAWNLRPNVEISFRDSVTVDLQAEVSGTSRFIFASKTDAGNFSDYFFLEDFQMSLAEFGNFTYLTLTNKFTKEAARVFLDTYRDAMNTLAIINEERKRAISNDGDKVGYVLMEHFTTRERNALNQISHARQTLGASSGVPQ